MLLTLVLVISVLSIGVAFYLIRWVMARDTGTPEMRTISDAIKEGAEAFLRRQNRTIAIMAAILAVVIFLLYGFVRSHQQFDPLASTVQMAFWITVSFILGALCSVIAGYIGMWVSIRSNIRTASAARTSLNDALRTALRGGAVAGLFVVSMSLLGIGGLFSAVRAFTDVPLSQIPLLIVGYGFGASFVALFAQLGGGIYTKAADVGADLVGKVEAGIPEDDPRNPAVIADLVGDNVGDCAGRGADLFESTAAENIGAMVLGATLATRADALGIGFTNGVLGVMLFPLVSCALGLIAAIVGIFVVKTREDADPMAALNRGYAVTAILAIIGFGGATHELLNSTARPDAWWMFFLCGVVGVLTAWAFVWITQYYTEYRYRPVREIANSSMTGPATNIISGIAVGMESTLLPVLTISIAILASYFIGSSAMPEGGLFGTAVATMGMLGTAAYILAMDTFGPITDNAGGIVEMSQQPDSVRAKTDLLDSVGNTTKAVTKGYAIGSAALAAFLLFSAYIDEVRNYLGGATGANGRVFGSVDISKPPIFIGALIGAVLVFYFSSLAIKAVGRAAQSVIADVRAQFREKPGIMLGTDRPDYARSVDIVTRGALRQMVLPGAVAVGTPILVGLVFKAFNTEADRTVASEAVAALLMVGTIAGILMALFLNNGGGAWDNAKKYIESNEFTVDGKVYGKRSDPHKAAVVGDTVGDPFKDTAGPSLHVLIKLLSTITLVLAPLFI